jgi:tetratricopeptide (TPR) repeat protein
MMKNNITAKILAIALTLCGVSCNEFLDELPDNRTELDTKNKIAQLLTSAYSGSLFVYTTEMMSDNFDDFGKTYSSQGRIQEQLFHWEDVTDDSGSNESPKQMWRGYYSAIAHANQALQAIEELGNPPDLDPHRGEALICRAYHHFILVNVFCKHYSAQTSATDLGIPYVEKPETFTDPQYTRGTVAEVYAKIERDLQAALPLIDDGAYTVPKYHFNRAAAHAFASRFYLYCGKYNKVIDHANEVLGSNPTNMLRNVEIFSTMTLDYSIIANEYIKPEHNANLLLVTAISDIAALFGPYAGTRYMFSTSLLSRREVMTDGPWGDTNPYFLELTYSYGPMGFSTVGKLPRLFEFVDPVARIGYLRTVLVALGADEVLLNRAEAYVQLRNYDAATVDIGLWVRRHLNPKNVILVVPTRSAIWNFYNNTPYYTSSAPTPKKKLNPETPVAQGSELESFLHCLLHIRRIELLFEGLRWFDVKRYGIEITRRTIDENLTVQITDTLKVDDPRRAIQLPADVISAGLTPNPR